MNRAIEIAGALAGAAAGWWALKTIKTNKAKLGECPVCQAAQEMRAEWPLAVGSGAVVGFGAVRLAKATDVLRADEAA